MEQHKCITCGSLYPAEVTKCPVCGQPCEELGEVNDKDEKMVVEMPSKKNHYIPYDGLIWSIIVMVFCFFPTGLAAVFYSLKVDYFWFKGEKDYAIDLSEKALLYRKISVGIFIGFVILFLIIRSIN